MNCEYATAFVVADATTSCRSLIFLVRGHPLLGYVLGHPEPLTQHKSQQVQATSAQSAAKKSIFFSQNTAGTLPKSLFLAKIKVWRLVNLLNADGTVPDKAFQSRARYSAEDGNSHGENNDGYPSCSF